MSLRAPGVSWLKLQTGDLYSQTSPSAVTARSPKPPLPPAGTIRAGPARDVNRSPWVRRRVSPGLENRGRTPWARSPCQRTSSEHRDRNLLAVRQTWSTSRYVVSSASELRVYEGGWVPVCRIFIITYLGPVRALSTSTEAIFTPATALAYSELRRAGTTEK